MVRARSPPIVDSYRVVVATPPTVRVDHPELSESSHPCAATLRHFFDEGLPIYLGGYPGKDGGIIALAERAHLAVVNERLDPSRQTKSEYSTIRCGRSGSDRPPQR